MEDTSADVQRASYEFRRRFGETNPIQRSTLLSSNSWNRMGHCNRTETDTEEATDHEVLLIGIDTIQSELTRWESTSKVHEPWTHYGEVD